MTRLLALLNLALLIAFPVAWAAPLMRAGLLPFFGMSEVSILSGVRALWASDPALAILVAALAMVAPYLKILTLAGIQFGYVTPRALPSVKFLSRLAMADVFLIAIYIVAAKGVGVGRIETAWGLWLFTGCVGLSLVTSWITPRR